MLISDCQLHRRGFVYLDAIYVAKVGRASLRNGDVFECSPEYSSSTWCLGYANLVDEGE